MKNCIRKSFTKVSGFQCFNNCPIYSTQYLEKYHTENLGPFKCGKSDCYYNGLHEKQWSANRCKGNNHSQDSDNSKSAIHYLENQYPFYSKNRQKYLCMKTHES